MYTYREGHTWNAVYKVTPYERGGNYRQPKHDYKIDNFNFSTLITFPIHLIPDMDIRH